MTLKWQSLVQLGKYFGVIDKEDAEAFVEPEVNDFKFDIDHNGERWVSVPKKKSSKKDKPSN